jgi:hypothetical protein
VSLREEPLLGNAALFRKKKMSVQEKKKKRRASLKGWYVQPRDLSGLGRGDWLRAESLL